MTPPLPMVVAPLRLKIERYLAYQRDVHKENKIAFRECVLESDTPPLESRLWVFARTSLMDDPSLLFKNE